MTARRKTGRVTLALFVAAATIASFSSSANAVVLGSPSVYPTGSGWGIEQPGSISNGGVPSGNAWDISWKEWGGPTAYGTGKTSLYRPAGNYYAKPGEIRFRATAIGTCPADGGPAYTQLSARIAHWPGGPLGEWFAWGRLSSICDQLFLPYTGTVPGFCGNSGDGAGDGYDVRSYGYVCSKSLKLVRKVNRRIGPRCIRHGCKIRRSRFKCTIAKNTGNELSGGEYPYPIHRVACRRGARNVSWHHMLNYD